MSLYINREQIYSFIPPHILVQYGIKRTCFYNRFFNNPLRIFIFIIKVFAYGTYFIHIKFIKCYLFFYIRYSCTQCSVLWSNFFMQFNHFIISIYCNAVPTFHIQSKRIRMLYRFVASDFHVKTFLNFLKYILDNYILTNLRVRQVYMLI